MEELIILDPEFGVVVKAVGKLDFIALMRPPYVALIGAILGQRIPFETARKLRGIVYTALGTNFTYVEFEDWTQASLKIPSDKLKIIRTINAYLKTQPPDFLNKRANIESLQHTVPGIGPWTVKTVLLMTFMDPDIFPADDYFIQKRLQRLFNLPKPPTATEAERISQRWRPYRSYYSMYLWRWI